MPPPTLNSEEPLIVYLGFVRLSISQHMSASPRSHNVIG